MNPITTTRVLAFVLAFASAGLVGCSEDSTAPEVNAPRVIETSFEDGTEGWSAVGDFENLTTSRTQPVRGNHLRALDRAEGPTWYFVASPAYAGDRGSYYGGRIHYYVRTVFADGRDIENDDYYVAPDIVLEGAGVVLDYHLPRAAYPIDDLFRSISVPLEPGPAWRNRGTGEPATADDLREVLGNLTQLLVRGEYLSGADYGMIDEFVLEPR